MFGQKRRNGLGYRLEVLKKMAIKYHLQILGCQANEADGQRLRALLASHGFQPAETAAEARLIILLACSVRQNAMDYIYRQSAQWHKRRKAGQLKTILSGCVLAVDKKKLAPYFDWITEITSLPQWPERLREWFGEEIGASGKFGGDEAGDVCRGGASSGAADYLDLPAAGKNPYSALVPIMNGCNNFCTYCAVPYTRGREVSRTSKKILAEVTERIRQSAKEITLLGQNVNSYHCPETGADFPALLREIQGLEGDFWLRFMTSHPKDLSPELLSAIGECDKVCEHLHLPIQAGSNEILKAMNRHYTREQFEKLAADFRAVIEQTRNGARKLSAVTTDAIVGFPGETEADFEQTAEVFRAVGFDLAYIARYSVRPGTAAEKLTDDVPTEEKKRRDVILNRILKETARKNNEKYLGQTIDGLVLREHKNGEMLARTRTAKNLFFMGGEGLLGQVAKIKITRVDAWGLWGEI